MKRPKIVIIDDEKTVASYIKEKIESTVIEETGIPFEVKTYSHCPEDISEITDASLFFIDFFMPQPHKKGDEIARELKRLGAQGQRILITGSLPDVVEQLELGKKGFFERDSTDRAKALEAWYKVGGPELFPHLLTKPFESEDIQTVISNLRQNDGIMTPLNVGVVGLGKLGLGTLQELVKEPWISSVRAYTGFVNGSQEDYQKVLASLDLPGEERAKITTHSNLEELAQENPDVIVIATGEFNTPYHQYSDRTQLRERLFRKGLPKINQVLKAVKETNCQSLLAMESNPNGQFIHHAIEQEIDPTQLTSFSPDTMRHVRTIYENLKRRHPELSEEDINMMVEGDHMKGGTPVYEEATVKGQRLKVFEPRFVKRPFQTRLTKKSRDEGLNVMKSAVRYGHDYRGVPRKVKEGLREIAFLHASPRYSIYAGLVSVPARFVYEADDGTFYPRVKPAHEDIKDFTEDQHVIRELKSDVKRIKREVRRWTKSKSK